MNFIDAVYKDKKLVIAGRYVITIPQNIIKIIESLSLNEMLLGARPEHISINFDKTDPEDIEAEIYAIEYLGNETIVDLYNKDLGEDKIIKARIPWRFKDDVGRKVWMKFDKNNLYYFDAAAQTNILHLSAKT